MLPVEALRNEIGILERGTDYKMAFTGYAIYNPHLQEKSLGDLTESLKSGKGEQMVIGAYIAKPNASEGFIPLLYDPRENVSRKSGHKPLDFLINEKGQREGDCFVLGRFLVGSVREDLGPLLYSSLTDSPPLPTSKWESVPGDRTFWRKDFGYVTGEMDPEEYHEKNRKYIQGRPGRFSVLNSDLKSKKRREMVTTIR
jgi:hypothetical protein